ncbi:hypothetical protein GCM10010329_74650 [Streptomyces spiroverticillatus]|uniref:Lipoprotein n=1 Tax=Streptomyces finlayi TaxID=67296 RepID=A0A919CFB2_9ACTN|nr:hypothetical protein [Streptomyces finlayi]GHA40573.1 hypothetical protein GCM10010329_74650 [Streptomyces spiroverticillatus]GHD15395.1 hypothetical protein GCM10010334_75420 [Streptomyces finlayi]
MGAWRRVRHRRTLAAAVLAGATAVGVAACEPGGGGGLSTFAVALTTDQTGTRALERAGIDVAWLTCTSTVGDSGRVSANPSQRPSLVTAAPAARNVATVACQGQTKDGKEIRVDGKVTEERDGRCVRGDLTATVGERTVFRANVLGDCDARPTTRPPTWSPPPKPTVRPTWRPTRTVTATAPRPTTSPEPPSPRPTVTVTVTVGPDPAPDPAPDPRPTCSCPPGK